MRKELSKSELDLLATSQKINIDTLRSVRQLLDTKIVRNKLIIFEYKEQTKDRRVTKKQIIESLMKKYGFSKSYIEQIVYESRITHKPCKSCGEDTNITQWKRSGGICTKCLKKQQKPNNDDK